MATPLLSGVDDAWRSRGTRTDRDSVALLSVVAEHTTYEHRETASRIERIESLGEEATRGARRLRSLFSIDVSIHPPLDVIGVEPANVLSIATGPAKRRFVERIEAEGLAVEGERQTVRFDRGNGVEGRWFVLETAWQLPPEGCESETQWPTVDAETHVAIWPTETSYAMAGGTLPQSAPEGLAHALDANPERDRETVAAVVRSMAAPTAGTDESA